MGRFIGFLFFLLLVYPAECQVNIRLFYGEKSDAMVIKIGSGDYLLSAGRDARDKLEPGDMIFISREDGGINVSFVDREGYHARSITLTGEGGNRSFAIRRAGDTRGFTEYEGDLTVVNDLGTLLCLNSIDIENYIAAVVQSEGGYRAHPEFFKSQAVIARTYAYMHMTKHGDEGYDLCDDIHCQVYHGRCTEQVIIDAVKATEGLVIVDADTNLILTPFHSNCGGETVAAEQVWLTGKPYLLPVIDPYCAYSRNATWSKRVGVKEWTAYLRESGFEGNEQDILAPFAQNSRLKYYSVEGFQVPFTQLRNQMALRSSFFSIVPDGDSVLLSGRGYGHGVGLCQEGAMVMATRGFLFDSIIRFYYHNVLITDIGKVSPGEKEKDTF